MTKRELNRWREESVKQAVVQLTQERFTELLKAQQMAGYVA